mgnify:CR=1 FL=1
MKKLKSAKKITPVSYLSVFVLLLISAAAGPSLVQAQETERAVTVEAVEVTAETPAEGEDQVIELQGAGMDQLVSIEFRSTEVSDVLRYLGQKAALNMSISSAVSGRVNLFATEIPIRDIFDIVLRSSNLAFIRQGDLYHILTETEYKELYGERFSDTRIVKTFRLQYAIPEMAFNMLDALKSTLGRLLIDENSGTIMIMDTPDKIAEMEKALEVLERRGVIKIFDLKYAKAEDVELKLKDDFEINKLGSIKSDPRTNQLVVKTFSDRMNEVSKTIEALDRKTREVLIDARIVKVTLNKNVNTGIDWNSIFSNIEFNGVDKVGDFRRTTDATTPGAEIPAVTPIQLASKFGLSTDGPLGRDSFGDLIFTTIARDGYELFRYLDTIGETRIISKPRLLVTENQQAQIHVGTREAFITTTTTTGTSTATTAEEVQFIDVGIKFLVTPRITSDGYVEMKILPEVSSVVRTLFTQSGNQIPIVDTSTAETNVIVKDGATVIIGGLRKNEKLHDDDQVPGFNKIPLIGNLFFKQVDHEDEAQELVIFITPHIVNGDKLVTGDEDSFGGAEFKGFRDYNIEKESDVVLPAFAG